MGIRWDIVNSKPRLQRDMVDIYVNTSCMIKKDWSVNNGLNQQQKKIGTHRTDPINHGHFSVSEPGIFFHEDIPPSYVALSHIFSAYWRIRTHFLGSTIGDLGFSMSIGYTPKDPWSLSMGKMMMNHQTACTTFADKASWKATMKWYQQWED